MPHRAEAAQGGGIADLDAEIVIFIVSSVVLLAGLLQCRFDLAEGLAAVGFAFSSSTLCGAARRRGKRL